MYAPHSRFGGAQGAIKALVERCGPRDSRGSNDLGYEDEQGLYQE